MRRLTVCLILPCLALAAGCGSDDEDPKSDPRRQGTGPADHHRGRLQGREGPEEEARRHRAAPDGPLDSSKTYTVKLETSCGDFTIGLDQKASPQAAASFVSLSRKGFFDDTVFHRIVPGFVIQGGDPTASGMGGPATPRATSRPPDAQYTTGRGGDGQDADEPAGTAGSQFYVVTGADAGLPAEYAVLGKVTEGIDTVERSGSWATPTAARPGRPASRW